MGEVECPFCGSAIKVEELYGDDQSAEFQCRHCDKEVVVRSSVSVSFSAYCKDGEHDIVPAKYAGEVGYEECSRCDGVFRRVGQ